MLDIINRELDTTFLCKIYMSLQKVIIYLFIYYIYLFFVYIIIIIILIIIIY